MRTIWLPPEGLLVRPRRPRNASVPTARRVLSRRVLRQDAGYHGAAGEGSRGAGKAHRGDHTLMPSGPPPNQIRTSIYLPRKLHRKMRETLASRGAKVSGLIVR